MSRLILASTSLSRQSVLRAAGIAFEAVAPGVDEEAVKQALTTSGAGPRDIAVALARGEALAVSRRRRGPVIGADQTLELDGVLFDKPHDMMQARETLRRLRARRHVLHSAVVVAKDGVVQWGALVSPQLTMWPFTDRFLEDYLAREGERVLSSVGAYLIEGPGIQLFEKIDGDHFAILGLPLLPLLNFLRTTQAEEVVEP